MTRKKNERAQNGTSPVKEGQCAWITAGRRCLRLASSFDGQTSEGPGYCTWHVAVRDDPRWAQDRREFERFLDDLLTQYPLYRQRSVWGEANRDRLWQECLGETWSPPALQTSAVASLSLPRGDRDA